MAVRRESGFPPGNDGLFVDLRISIRRPVSCDRPDNPSEPKIEPKNTGIRYQVSGIRC